VCLQISHFSQPLVQAFTGLSKGSNPFYRHLFLQFFILLLLLFFLQSFFKLLFSNLVAHKLYWFMQMPLVLYRCSIVRLHSFFKLLCACACELHPFILKRMEGFLPFFNTCVMGACFDTSYACFYFVFRFMIIAKHRLPLNRCIVANTPNKHYDV